MKKLIVCLFMLVLAGCTSTTGNKNIHSVNFEVEKATITDVVTSLGKPSIKQIVNGETWLTYAYSTASGFINVKVESTGKTYQFNKDGLLVGLTEMSSLTSTF